LRPPVDFILATAFHLQKSMTCRFYNNFAHPTNQVYCGTRSKGSSLLDMYLFGISLFRSACRDVLTWPGAYLHDLPMFKSTFEDDQNGEAKVRLKNDLQARLGTLLESFCPNLNCVQPACPMHGGCSSKHRSPDLIII
jgi:hypothetical protein